MTRIVLVRHGETVWHEENRYAGISDIALTPRGVEQAGRVAEWAASADLTAIWVSPLSRAIATAEPAAIARKLKPVIDPRLREIDFGQAEGKTMAQLESEMPDAVQAFKADPAANPFPSGEDPRAAASRAVDCLRDIAKTHPVARVMVVAHNTLFRLALCQLLGIPLASYRTVFPSVRNGALTEIQIEGTKTALLQYNGALIGSKR